MKSQSNAARAAKPATRTAASRARRTARPDTGRVVELYPHVWFDRFYDLAMPWPEGVTTVETIAAAIRAAA